MYCPDKHIVVKGTAQIKSEFVDIFDVDQKICENTFGSIAIQIDFEEICFYEHVRSIGLAIDFMVFDFIKIVNEKSGFDAYNRSGSKISIVDNETILISHDKKIYVKSKDILSKVFSFAIKFYEKCIETEINCTAAQMKIRILDIRKFAEKNGLEIQ